MSRDLKFVAYLGNHTADSECTRCPAKANPKNSFSSNAPGSPSSDATKTLLSHTQPFFISPVASIDHY